jgi:hypothetical protein
MAMSEEMNKQPCAECPFRRKSLRGYVGGHKNAGEIIDIVWHDENFPCHMKVTAIRENLRESLDGYTSEQFHAMAVSIAPSCVGGAIFLNNHYKLSRHPDVMSVQNQTGKSQDVFSSREEMERYHNSAKWNRSKAARAHVTPKGSQ